MKFLRVIMIPALLLAIKVKGQQGFNLRPLVGKTFVSKTLEYLKILNDSTLYSSINPVTDIAKLFLQNDTLFIKDRFWTTDQNGTRKVERVYDYKIIAISNDTLILKNNYRYDFKPASWEDTLFFVNIENLMEPVSEFKYLQLKMSGPWDGQRQITVDSSGNVTYIHNPIPYSINNPQADKNARPKNLRGRLTRKENLHFKKLLSKSLVSKLPPERECGLDGGIADFEIVIGKKTIKSTGCELSWIHAFFQEYLYYLDQSKGLRKVATSTPTQ